MTDEQKIIYRKEYRNRNKQKIREKRRKYNKKYYAKTRKYSYSNWNPKMDKIVLEHKMTDNEISELIKKSVMSIQVRRWRLKNGYTNKVKE